jgi:hypothetical protein
MDLARVKYCIAHIDEHPESLTHCNGVDMAYFLPEDVRELIAEVERLTAKCDDRRNMLEDVVNELDLSDGMVEVHGPLGTAPAELVRLILMRKDREITMLKSGMIAAEAVLG